MVRVSGRLLDFVEDPSHVAQVQVRAREVRPHGDGVMLDHPVDVEWDPGSGTVTFDAAAGTAGVIMWHAVGRSHASGSLPIVVPDGATATLRQCVEAALVADDATVRELERLAAEFADDVEVARHAAATAGKSAYEIAQDQGFLGSVIAWLESLKGDKGDKGDRGPAGSIDTLDESIMQMARDAVDAQLVTELVPGTDWNTLTSPGLYYRRYSVGTPDPNEASSGLGVLWVGDTMNPSGFVVQVYLTAYSGGVFYRSQGGGGSWARWGQFATTAQLDTKADKGHKHTSADISDSTINVAGNADDAYKVLSLDYLGRLRVDTAAIEFERDVASAGYVNDAVDAINGLVESILGGTDLDTLLADESKDSSTRTYSISGSATPSGGPGILGVTKGGRQYTQVFYAKDQPGVWKRHIVDRSHIPGGTWGFGEWEKLGADNPARMNHGEARRSAIVHRGVLRRGGVIGTGGKAAIALRFDHYLDVFGEKVMPLLRKYRLPWGQAINPVSIGRPGNSWTWAQLATECHATGGEVWNHGYSHIDITTVARADQEITLSKNMLDANLPSLVVDGWMPPGQANMMGMEGGGYAHNLWDSYPGRLVLAQHAFIRGYYPSPYAPITGFANIIGHPHITLDSQTYSWAAAVIRGVMTAKGGLTFMLHPNYLDQSGYMSTADLEDTFAYIAQLRDQGELKVLSPTGIMLADVNRPHDVNPGNADEHGTVNGSWSKFVSERSAKIHYGVPHELEVWFKGSGQVTLGVQITSPTNPVSVAETFTLDGTARRLSVLVTPPLDTTGTTISITGTGSHTGVRYRPI